MEKQSFELIEGMSRKYDVRKIVYDGTSGGRLKFFLTLIPEIKKILKENPGISFIHLNDGLMAVFGLLIKRITDLPVFVTLHGLDVVFPNGFYQRHIVERFGSFDGLIPVSRATASECEKRGIDPGKIFTIRNGVDPGLGEIRKEDGFRKVLEKRLGISLEGKRILVSIGRAVTRKGFSWFIENVMTKLEGDFVYLIIGASNESTVKLQSILKFLPQTLSSQISFLFAVETDKVKIYEAIKKNDLGKRVFFMGKQEHNSMIQILRHSDLFVMPNIKVWGDAEGFGLVALEAAVCGLPVAAADMEGITDAITDGSNGYLIEPGNAGAWLSIINKIFSDISSLREFGEKAKEFTIQNYSWERMVEQYISVFEDNIRKRAAVSISIRE